MAAELTSAELILRWFDQHGRKNLPWQHNTSAYRVWVSEIMLQQTQVATVIDYYTRFMQSFADVHALAGASEDDVLHHWTGLGYYARARNLHKTAKIVSAELEGEFPTSVDELEQLPGIGRSTAGAIHAISTNQRAVILDGNVKRVLARMHCVEGWYGHTAVGKQLWALAEELTPPEKLGRAADFTQAIMDLGATLCTRSKPNCEYCPVQASCRAFATDTVSNFPHSKPKKDKPVKRTQMLLLANKAGEFLLEKRPNSGIWGGLWSLPELACEQDAADYCRDQWNLAVVSAHQLPEHRHTFSHYHLDISPVLLHTEANSGGHSMEANRQLWYNVAKPASIGLAAPVKRLLEQAEAQANTH